VIRVECSIVKKGLVLLHSGVEGNIIILLPASEGVEEEDGVLVSLLQQLLSGVLQDEYLPVVERVPPLEGIDAVSLSLLHHVVDLSGGESVLVKVIIECNLGYESCLGSSDAEVSLGHDPLYLGVLGGLSSEGPGADFFLSVIEEDGVFDDSQDLGAEFFAGDGDPLFVLESLSLFSRYVLGDGNGEEMLLSMVGDSLHLQDLQELELIHESSQWVGPSLPNSLKILSLFLVDVNAFE